LEHNVATALAEGTTLNSLSDLLDLGDKTEQPEDASKIIYSL
jgi:hypothetical protein